MAQSAAGAHADECVAAVRDDPDGRLALLRRLYEVPRPYDRGYLPYLRAATAFMRWQHRRGLLNPESGPCPGSPWWRTLNEALLSGEMIPGQTVTGRLYLGAGHPTNPFRHRRHPDHTLGRTITRQLTLEVGTNSYQAVGFGVDRLSGIYREEISGLHKPLGPNQNIGLKTEGTFTLNRVSLVGRLNQ